MVRKSVREANDLGGHLVRKLLFDTLNCGNVQGVGTGSGVDQSARFLENAGILGVCSASNSVRIVEVTQRERTNREDSCK